MRQRPSRGTIVDTTPEPLDQHYAVNGVNIGWTEAEGEDAVQRRFHDADDTWLEKANASVPMGKLGQPEEIADLVVFLLSDRSGVVTGSIIDWDRILLGAFD